MKKILSMLVVTTLIFTLASVASAASPAINLNRVELKNLHEHVLDLVRQGKADKVDSLPLVKKYKKQFEKNPELFQEYVSSLDVFNPDKVKSKLQGESLFTDSNQTIVVMDDGSFIVAKQSLLPTNGINTDVGGIGTQATTNYYTTTSGTSWTDEVSFEYWGAYLAVRTKLNTTFTVYTSSIDITEVNTTGTVAYFPHTVSSSSEIVTDNATTVKSKGEYTQVDYIAGIPVRTTIHGLTDEISIVSTSGTTVQFKTVAEVQN